MFYLWNCFSWRGNLCDGNGYRGTSDKNTEAGALRRAFTDSAMNGWPECFSFMPKIPLKLVVRSTGISFIHQSGTQCAP